MVNLSRLYTFVKNTMNLMLTEFSAQISTEVVYLDLYNAMQQQPRMSRKRPWATRMLNLLSTHRRQSLRHITDLIDPDMLLDLMKECDMTKAPIGVTSRIFLRHMLTYCKNVRKVQISAEHENTVSNWMSVVSDTSFAALT